MKKIFSVFMLMACMLCSIGLSACSDDDEPAEDYYYVRYSAGINPEPMYLSLLPILTAMAISVVSATKAQLKS